MKRLAPWVLILVCQLAPAWAQSDEAKEHPRGQGVERTEERMEDEESRLILWKWANFAVLAGAIIYFVAKNGGPFFEARSRQIRKEMIEAAEVRKDAEGRAAEVDRKLASLAADIARLKAESELERKAETERLFRHREAERVKIQAHADREIESAGKAARLELKRYAGTLAIEMAEKKIRARMDGQVQEGLVRGFVNDLAKTAWAART